MESTDFFGLQNGSNFRQRKGISGNDNSCNTLLGEKAQKKLEKLKLGDCKMPGPRSPTHIVDKLARVIFPLSYFVFNFAYWWIAVNRV